MDTVWHNLRIAFPERSPGSLFCLRLRFYFHLIRLVKDWLRLDKIDWEYLRSNSEFSLPLETIQRLAKARPVVFFTGHVGNWEMANLYGEYISGDYGVLVRMQTGKLAKFLAKKREVRNIKIYYAGKNEKTMVRDGKETALGIVIDHRVRSGIPVRFFSKGCFFPRGVLWLIRKLQAKAVASFVVYPYRGRRRYRLIIKQVKWKETEDDRTIAQRFTDELEKIVRNFPEQYLWSFKRWKFSWEIKVLVLKDGRPGHWRQSLSMVEILRRTMSDRVVSVREVDLAGIERDLFTRFLLTLSAFVPTWLGWNLVKWGLKGRAGEVLHWYADVVISTGSSLAGLNLFLRRLNQSKSVIIMDPGWGLRRADLLITPFHDRLKGSNVISIPGALSFFDKEKACKDAERLSVPKGSVAVFLGGPVLGYDFKQARIDFLLNLLRDFEGEVLITTSRRTPKWVEEEVRKGKWGYLVIASEYNPPGVVGAMLEQGNKILVTADSISMISEAISSGKQVGVWVPIYPSGKHRVFIEGLFSRGWAVPISDGDTLKNFLCDQRQNNVSNDWLANLMESVKRIC